MKKLLIALLAGILSLAFVGCANLKEKSVIVGTGGIGGKAGITIDPSSGYPLPEVVGGEFDGAFVDHKIGDGDIIVIDQEKSMWSSEISKKSVKFMGKNGGVSCTIDMNNGTISIVGAPSESTKVDSGINSQVTK